MPPDSTSPRLLVVDDNAEIRALLAAYLSGSRYDIQFVESGGEALAAMALEAPDLVLLDVEMEGMNGYEVCEWMQREPRLTYIPVVFVTAMEAREHRWRAFASGAADFLSKPIEKQALLDKIEINLETTANWPRLESQESGSLPAASSRDQRDSAYRPDLNAFLRWLATEERLSNASEARLLRATPATLWSLLRETRIPMTDMGRRIATFLDLKYVAQVEGEEVALGVLPVAFCKANSVVPITREGGGAAFVMGNPFDIETLDSLRFCLPRAESVEIIVTEYDTLLYSEEELRSGPVPLLAEESDCGAGSGNPSLSPRMRASSRETETPIEAEILEESAAQAPVVRLVDQILSRALEVGASDVHVEPHRAQLSVRYRRDGLLEESDPIPANIGAAVVSRLKILSRLDIAERRMPQDGHARLSILGRDVDIRISTLPTRHGEKIVLRILDQSVIELDFAALGLDPRTIDSIRESANRPNGILLITGPTGSGKTTTLYTILNDLNRRETNIVTVEDPVELELDGVSQVEVRAELGLDFPSVLRSVLRQDPDIILIGEIRDRETADIAVKAALSGHLVLSTLHTNDAASSIARLVDMGVEPFLLSAAVRMVAAQRLVRTLCAECKTAVPSDTLKDVSRRLGFSLRPDDSFFAPVGCNQCRQSGYVGRTAVLEILQVDDRIRDLVSTSSGVREIRDAAIELGMTELLEAGIGRARNGVTSLEEVIRMIGSDSASPSGRTTKSGTETR